MFEIAMTVCLMADPAKCKRVSLTFADQSVTAVQCQMGVAGMSEIVKWTQSNPKWKPARWSCRVAGQFANI